jgi:hypothetical protein
MVKRALLAILFCGSLIVAKAQLTTDQKISDFHSLADTFAKRYAIFDWKHTLFGVDPLNTGGWIERVKASKDDLEFYDLCVEYVAGLNDAHDGYSLPATFFAHLGFTVDIYDGKVLVESIDRRYIGPQNYVMAVGDEVLTVDFVPVQDLMTSFTKYAIAANPRSTMRAAASMMTRRPQALMPQAGSLGPSAIVTILHNGVETLQVFPWQKSGLAVTVLTAPPAVHSASINSALPAPDVKLGDWRAARQNFRVNADRFIAGMGEIAPVFRMPANFVQRLGKDEFDNFFSGSFQSGGKKIGFLRIPSFEMWYTGDLETEIPWLQANTDALIVDLMRNPGGYGCTAEDIAGYLMPHGFRGMTQEVQVTWTDILELTDELEWAKSFGSPEDVQAAEWMLNTVESAYRSNNGRTVPIPVCGTSVEKTPARDSAGKVIAYGKPVVLLTDDFSASAAELFAAMMQDNGRARLAGFRTMGAGGAVIGLPAGIYSEGAVSVTVSLLNRPRPIATAEYPAAPYIENIGVRPDIELDYMTAANLRSGGKGFFDSVTALTLDHIKGVALSRQFRRLFMKD